MRIQIVMAAACLAALGGCRESPDSSAPTQASNSVESGAAPLPDADINASLGLLGADPEPADQATGADRFIGRWAAHEGLCENNAWTFTAEELRTPTGTVCRLGEISDVPGGYDIAANCTVGGEPREDRLQLRFAESAEGLLFDADHIQEAGLSRCPA